MHNRKEMEAKINMKAWKDPHFKKKLLGKDARHALKEIGIDVPEKLEVKVVEEPRSHWCIVLHQAPVDSKKLSDQESKKIAAAGTWDFTCDPCECFDRSLTF